MEYDWSKRLTATAASVGISVWSLFGRRCKLCACMCEGGGFGRVCVCSALASGSDGWDSCSASGLLEEMQ